MPYHVMSTGWLQADGVVWYHVLSIRVQEHYTNIAIGSPVYGLQIGHCMICKRYGVSYYGFGSHHVMSSSPKQSKSDIPRCESPVLCFLVMGFIRVFLPV
jgi:hypothetical protein